MNIGFIGIGQVGSALAGSLLKAAHHVTIAARDLQSSSSVHLEHMTLLWIRLGRVQGKGPNFV